MADEKTTNEDVQDDSWAYLGEEGEREMSEDAARAEAAKAARKNYVHRFWLKDYADGRETRITFVDDVLTPSAALKGKKPPFRFYEHQLNLNGHWRNWFTCVGEDRCPLCQAGNRRYFAVAYTIINGSSYTNDKDVTYRDELNLLVAKRDPATALAQLFKKKGGSKGSVWDVKRLTDKEANIGGHYDFQEFINLPEETGTARPRICEPFDYWEILKPKPIELMERIVGKVKAEGESIPF